MRSAQSGRLHVITDEVLRPGRTHLELARHAALGGADVVQLREKRNWTTRTRVNCAREIGESLGSDGPRLLVNDRVDVALAAGLDAVHLGQEDLDVELARKYLGAGAYIGRTANTPDQVQALDLAPVDYLGVGPVFATQSKDNPPPALGVRGLASIVAQTRHPVIAIGGIRPADVAAILDAGAHGVAVLSAVVGADDPELAVREFADAIGQWEELQNERRAEQA